MALARSLCVALLGGALCAAPLSAQAPTGTVAGRVVDAASQEPLGGTEITVADRSARTTADGRFVITGVPAGSHIVRARRLGYTQAVQQVTVTAGETISIEVMLAAQAVDLSAVVVTGYGEQRQGDITGAVSQVSAGQFNTGRVIAPAQLIQSKVAGVQVVDNNEPGGGLTIRIRGATSVNASSDPLYVIDGMPVGSGAGGGLSAGRDPLNALNPDEIESISVLRDASAAAIYGANAANGVVLITTKIGARDGRSSSTAAPRRPRRSRVALTC